MMGFIENVNTVFRCRQNDSTPKTQVGQYQIMICHNTICFLHIVAAPEKTAITEVGTAISRALSFFNSDAAPLIIV